MTASDYAIEIFKSWQNDWCLFAEQVLGVNLDIEQQNILRSVQVNKMTSVASGTARGKDFVAAVAAVCFLYLTPRFDESGNLIKNTKVALTAPTGRQVVNIMVPEFSRLIQKAKKKGFDLPGRRVGNDIRTDYEEWFLTAFKADEHHHEAWSGFHATNTMFVVTEATGISDDTFEAIEGNLQGNSRILIVFNPNKTVGYAAKSQKGERWAKFRLNSLTAPNVTAKKVLINGQVDYEWVVDKLENWCMKISKSEFDESFDDFEFEGQYYRPEDNFRKKVLGKFPKVAEDVLIPEQWIELANERYKEYHKTHKIYHGSLKIGVDVAGMGRDASVKCYRYDNIVSKMVKYNSVGVATHMELAGSIANDLRNIPNSWAIIDTIGEGAAIYPRILELGHNNIISCKYSESAKSSQSEYLTDITGQYTFANMRAYLFWAVRDFLNPRNNHNAMLPPSDTFLQEATEIKWKFQSNGQIIIEPKEDIVKRLGRSTDEFDALANTFYPIKVTERITDYEGLFY